MQVVKVNTVVDLTYQAAKLTTGLTDVTMVIYDETRSLDGTNYPDVVMTEISSTGRYHGSFTPDTVGVWTIMIDSASKSGPLVETVIVTNQDLDSLGTLITNLNDLSSTEVESIISVSEGSILSAIGDIGTPAMLG